MSTIPEYNKDDKSELTFVEYLNMMRSKMHAMHASQTEMNPKFLIMNKEAGTIIDLDDPSKHMILGQRISGNYGRPSLKPYEEPKNYEEIPENIGEHVYSLFLERQLNLLAACIKPPENIDSVESLTKPEQFDDEDEEDV